MPRYLVSTDTISRRWEVEISKERFERVIEAASQVRLALTVEEKFNMLLDNFRAFERDLLEASLGTLVFDEFDWMWSQERIYTASRYLANVLSTAKTYIDNVHHHLGNDRVHGLFSHEYDQVLEYRVMEAIRNHTQHQDIGVTGFEQSMQRIEEIGRPVSVKHVIRLNLPVANLHELKANVKADLVSAGISDIPLIPYLRAYVAALARVHLAIREKVLPDVLPFEAEIHAVVLEAEAAASHSSSLAGLSLIEEDDAGRVTRTEHLVPELMERRSYLVRRTARAQHIANHYVSGEVY